MESEKKKTRIRQRVFSVLLHQTTISTKYILFSNITLISKEKSAEIDFRICWNEMILRGVFFIITVLIVLPLQTLALSPFYSFRHISQQNTVSPSPTPSQSCNGGTSTSCHLKNITVCFIYSSQTGLHEERSVFVQNNGENPFHVKIMILPVNNTIKEIDLLSHQMMKINISSDVNLSSGVVLNTSNGNCVIHAAAPPPTNYNQNYRSCATYITPINGAYLVIMLLIIGGILTFFKLRIRARHLKGVPYHELELGNSADLSMEETEDKKENWDQDWDDEWGDEKSVKSGGDNHVIVEQTNGLTIKMPNDNRKIKEWND